MPVETLFSYATLLGFLFTLARVSGVFAFLPLAAYRAAPEAAKIILSLAFTVILWPQWKSPVTRLVTQGTGNDAPAGRVIAGLAGEMAIGLAIGLIVAIVLELFQVAAQIVSLQAGFGFASTIDPTSGADSTVLISLAQLTAGLLFFTSGGDRMLVRVLADSLRLCPPESFTVKTGWSDAIVRFSSTIFSSGLRLAAPIVALLLLADISLAVLGRIQTQLHLVSLTMPVKLAATMLLLSATLAFQPGFFESMMGSGVRLMESLLRSAH
jgi:flagellar biosynthetic protein FliR